MMSCVLVEGYQALLSKFITSIAIVWLTCCEATTQHASFFVAATAVPLHLMLNGRVLISRVFRLYAA